MSKKYLLVVVIVLIVLAAGYWFWRQTQKRLAAKTPAKTSAEPAVKGTLPEIITNPLEKSPEINPVEKTNPFKDLYKNPFK